jgi:TP901 family phage tail tape measure protein
MAATASMKAALVLSFEDQLSSGLSKLEKQFDQLKRLGKELSLGRLASASEDLQPTIAATRDLAGELRGVRVEAKGAYADLKRMTGAYSELHTQRGFSRNDAAMVWGGPRARPEPARGGGAGGMMGELAAVGAGYGALQSTRSYASFEDIARRAGITKGLSGTALDADTKRLMALFSRDALATAQSGTNIGEAYLDLAGMGISPAEVERLLPIHSRVATAYNISPEVLSPATAALNQSFKISDGDMGGALAAMATATKEGRFKIEDFARFLPSIGGNMAKLGMTGRGSANEAFAALETVMKNSADPGSGAANFTDFMNYLTSPMAARSFALQSRGMGGPTKRLLEQYHITGIDMPKLLENARKQGVDPITAVLGTLQKKLAGLPPDVMAELLGAFFHNQQARDAALSLLQHSGEFKGMQKQLDGVDQGTLDRDYQSRMSGSAVQMKLLDEELAQLSRRIGGGFMPVVKLAVDGLDDLNSAFGVLNDIVPGLGDDVAAVGGGALGISAALGAVSLLMPTVGARLTRMLLAPAKLLTSEFKAAAAVLDVDMVAALGAANAAMVRFNTTTLANPLIRAGTFAFWLYNDMKGRMNQGVTTTPDGKSIDKLTPGQLFSQYGFPPSGEGRADMEDVLHRGPNLGSAHSAADIPGGAPGGTLGTIYVAIDPTTGAPVITRTDSTGVHLVPSAGAGPNPGQTTSRP